ncbi:MAG: hypothetical protein MUC29_00725, partial [Pyrinomonadaceae bacterium]|nr:hypothetical protein [Pyrinomonadaceae bacterium]
METPILSGKKRSRLNFMKIEIYQDRVEARNDFFLKKNIKLDEIKSWTEINKKINPGNINFTELTIYTDKTKYSINSLHWENYVEIREMLTQDKQRDTEKEQKIY